jgi:hypothetical protein
MVEHIQITVELSKALATENDDGSFTPQGMKVLGDYARAWVAGKRDLLIEGANPELAGTFYDIRIDGELAQQHALPDDVDLEVALSKSFPKKKKKKAVTFVVPQ